ncbi:hypothetical protein HYX11_04065 [Candidatus Woesearchaeota archaeon]|nr:hypothetical protein [Candidatus Woesearchaeota archaeon]
MFKKNIKKKVNRATFLNTHSNKIIIGLLAVAVVLTVYGTLINIDNLGKLSFSRLFLTGAATSGTGNASVTVQGTASMTMTYNSISFPTGYYNETCNPAKNYSTLASDTGISSCWLNTSGLWPDTWFVVGNHTITNAGTTYLSINLTPSVLNGTELFCGSPGCPATRGAHSNVSVKSSSAELSSCSAGALSSFTYIVTSSTNQTVTICSMLDYADPSDTLAVYYTFTMPKDASQGTKLLNVTYTATAQ